MSNRIGDSRLVFGVADEAWGYVQNIKEDISSKKGEAVNGAGNTVAVEFHNVGEKKITGTYLFQTDQVADPAALVGSITGCTITNVTGTIYIDRAGKARAQGAWTLVDFEGTYYPFLVNS